VAGSSKKGVLIRAVDAAAPQRDLRPIQQSQPPQGGARPTGVRCLIEDGEAANCGKLGSFGKMTTISDCPLVAAVSRGERGLENSLAGAVTGSRLALGKNEN
jgi:hypothetical protein